MKIAFALFRYFPHGGMQKDFARIAAELVRRGHQCTLFAGVVEGEVPAGVECRRIKLHCHSNHGRAAEFEKKFFELSQGFDLRFGFNRMEHLDFYFAADNCLLREASAKYPRWYLKLSPRYRTFLRQEKAVFAPGSSCRILTITTRQQQDFHTLCGTEMERMILLPPGLDPECRFPEDGAVQREIFRKELGIGDDEFLLLQIGSVFHGKGMDRFLAAVSALGEPWSSKVRIALIGNLDPAFCRKAAEKSGVPAEKLILPGVRHDIVRWLLAADLMVHPSRKDSAGAVITEAIACGLPVIASGECGFAPFAAQSGGVALPEPFEQRDLDKALRQMLAELPERKKITLDYGLKADFYRRASLAADAVEEFRK